MLDYQSSNYVRPKGALNTIVLLTRPTILGNTIFYESTWRSYACWESTCEIAKSNPKLYEAVSRGFNQLINTFFFVLINTLMHFLLWLLLINYV